ncbi:MAG: hypothetical protein GEU75_00720 [Dehalococcoidia bacterium]|nr:hypothetical protein [Dehalococcoidia bacterium]
MRLSYASMPCSKISIVGAKVPGRRNATDITLFDTIGVGAEDVAVATYCCVKLVS